MSPLAVGLIESEQNIVDPPWEFGVHLLAQDASSGGHGQVRIAVDRARLVVGWMRCF
jgi:hypothetical protein